MQVSYSAIAVGAQTPADNAENQVETVSDSQTAGYGS